MLLPHPHLQMPGSRGLPLRRRMPQLPLALWVEPSKMLLPHPHLQMPGPRLTAPATNVSAPPGTLGGGGGGKNILAQEAHQIPQQQ